MPKFGGDRTQANEIRNAAFTSRWNATPSSSGYCACSLSSPPGSHRACRTTPLRYLSTDERGAVSTVAIAGAQMCCVGRSRNQRLDARDRVKLTLNSALSFAGSAESDPVPRARPACWKDGLSPKLSFPIVQLQFNCQGANRHNAVLVTEETPVNLLEAYASYEFDH